MSRSPIDILFDRADMRCTICNAPAGSCACWTRCTCGWSYETGKACRNPKCEFCPSVALECPSCGAEKRVARNPSDPPKTARVRVACPKCIRGRTVTIEYFDAEGKRING
jgi:hypothetical protein